MRKKLQKCAKICELFTFCPPIANRTAEKILYDMNFGIYDLHLYAEQNPFKKFSGYPSLNRNKTYDIIHSSINAHVNITRYKLGCTNSTWNLNGRSPNQYCPLASLVISSPSTSSKKCCISTSLILEHTLLRFRFSR